MDKLFKGIVILLAGVLAFQLGLAVDWEYWVLTALSPVVHIVVLLIGLNIFAWRSKVDATQLLKKILEQNELMVKKLYDLEQALHPTVRANVIEIWVTKNGVRTKGDNMLGKIGEIYELECLPKYDDGAGNLLNAKIDGLPAWSVTDAALASIEVDPANGFKAKLTLLAEGSFVAQAACDVDRGEGVKQLIGEVAFDVAGPEATVIAVSVTKMEA